MSSIPGDGSYVFAGLEATDDEIHDFVACILRSHNPFIESLDFHSIIVILLRIYAAYLRIPGKPHHRFVGRVHPRAG